MRHQEFQFVEGSAKKFWNIRLEDAALTIHFGRIGTDGQTQRKTFDSAALADKEYQKAVREKVKKGYAEVTDGAAPAVPDTAPSKPARPSGHRPPPRPGHWSAPSISPPTR